MAKPSASETRLAQKLRLKSGRESVNVARALVALAEVLEGWDIGPGELPDGTQHEQIETFGPVAGADEEQEGAA